MALHRWKTTAGRALDEIEAAHRAVGGRMRGRRYATLQVNHAYAMLLSSQFQGFCRDLHSEAVQIVAAVAPASLRHVVAGALLDGRRLDRGNPATGNLGEDFGRLGWLFWGAVHALDSRNVRRHKTLDELNTWRNAIAHQDWSRVGPKLRLPVVRRWRSVCSALAAQPSLPTCMRHRSSLELV